MQQPAEQGCVWAIGVSHEGLAHLATCGVEIVSVASHELIAAPSRDDVVLVVTVPSRVAEVRAGPEPLGSVPLLALVDDSVEAPACIRGGADYALEATAPRAQFEAVYLAARREAATRRSKRPVDTADPRYRAMMENAGDAFLIADFETARFLEVNEAACAMFGYDEAEFRNLTGRMLAGPEGALTVDRMTRALIESGTALEHRHEVQRKDGSRFWATVRISPYELMGRKEYLVVLRDVTDQVQREHEQELAHARLLEAERRRAEDLGLINELGTVVAQHLDLPTVLSTVVTELARITRVRRVGLFLVDDAKTVLTAVACTERLEADLVVPLASNAALAHAFRTRESVLVEDAATDPRTNKDLVAQFGTRSIMTVPLISRGDAIGAIAIVETGRPRAFTETETARAVAVANLVSSAVANAKMFDDLRKSYEALARAQAELVTHERLAALGELSAVIAHEVRNPLAVIFNSLGALRRLDPPTVEATLLLDIVGEEAARLNRIVGELLDFVRPYTAHPSPVQVDAIVKGAVEAAERTAVGMNVAIRTHLRHPCNDVIVDGTMLQQALINLVVNAVQATPKGRAVTVSASARTAGEETNLCFDVVDEGPGVDAVDSARIFQPFFTTKATGTGLGLALVRRIAEALGGTIEVARAPSGGSIFTLAVPLVRLPQESGASPSS